MNRKMAKRIVELGLPSEGDISPRFRSGTESFDEECAREDFLGKTLEESEALFREIAQRYQEVLQWMGAAGFRFYIRAFGNYLKSKDSAGDSDAVSCFPWVIKWRLENPRSIAPVAQELREVCAHVVEHWKRYEVDEAIYGDLRPEYRALISRLEELIN